MPRARKPKGVRILIFYRKWAKDKVIKYIKTLKTRLFIFCLFYADTSAKFSK